MSDDLISESRISLNQLANEQDVSLSTAWRWCLRGIRGHQLESFSVGGRKYTTREAFARWMARTNGEPVAAGQTPRQRERAIDAAEKRAEALGV
jgi:hypothetical protein